MSLEKSWKDFLLPAFVLFPALSASSHPLVAQEEDREIWAVGSRRTFWYPPALRFNYKEWPANLLWTRNRE
jgi:hypothetical protein